MKALVNFNVALSCNGKVMDRGRGANVLDSPLSALRHLVDVLDMDPFNPPLRAGEIITTGTLTRAFPVAAGETWSTTIDGIALEGVTLKFTWTKRRAALADGPSIVKPQPGSRTVAGRLVRRRSPRSSRGTSSQGSALCGDRQ